MKILAAIEQKISTEVVPERERNARKLRLAGALKLMADSVMATGSSGGEFDYGDGIHGSFKITA